MSLVTASERVVLSFLVTLTNTLANVKRTKEDRGRKYQMKREEGERGMEERCYLWTKFVFC